MTPPSPAPADDRRSRWILALILLPLVATQLVYAATSTDMHVDGGYYLDVAMHVRDGRGLVSDVSLYHAGFPSFPHPSPIYPLWPLILGHLGRLVEITVLAHWLPFALWCASLGAAYLFGRRLLPGPLGFVRGLDMGHVLVVLLGAQREYSRFSVMPYTEGLAFALTFAMLWRLAGMKPRLRDGLELGAWLALVCLTRSQLFIAPIAVVMALGILGLLGGRQGRRWLLPGAAALGVVGLALWAWWRHSAGFVLDASPLTLLRFDQARVTDVLAPIDVIKDTRGVGELVLDRLSGIPVAWSIADWEKSYARGFFATQWALPLALPWLLLALVRLRWGALRAFLQGPQALSWLVVGLLGLGALATVHLPHKDGFGDWYFHRRHAIVCVLPFFLAAAFLLRRPRLLPRLVGIGVVVATIGLWGESQYWRLQDALDDPPADRDAELVQWMQDQATAEDPLIVALYAFHPPELAWRTDHVGYHWFYERTELEDLRKMFDELGAEFLVFRSMGTRTWRFRQDAKAFRALFQPVSGGPKGVLVYRRRSAASPAPGASPSAGESPASRKGSEPGE